MFRALLLTRLVTRPDVLEHTVSIRRSGRRRRRHLSRFPCLVLSALLRQQQPRLGRHHHRVVTAAARRVTVRVQLSGRVLQQFARRRRQRVL